MSISLSQQLALNDQYRATWEYFLRWALDILSYLTSVLMIHLFRSVDFYFQVCKNADWSSNGD
nr:hypothetical protein Iba_chr12aCG0750 [Ipomoea batatas]